MLTTARHAGARSPILRLARAAVLMASLVAGALLAIAAGDVMYSASLPDLRPWHTERLEHEFHAGQTGGRFGFDDYMAQERALFEEVERLRVAHFDPALDTAASRYAPGGGLYAKRVAGDWNRSYRLEAAPQKGVALLVHGLSDSPYSLRAIALALHGAGITVYGLRLPGHGTIPAGLDQVDWTDWLAAVALTVAQIRRDQPDAPFWYVGYSTGATLGLKHSVDAIDAGRLDLLPDRLFLLSPALGVSPFAPLANVQRLISRWGVAPKARWSNVGVEVDPYKYDSFAKNAGAQISALIARLQRDLVRLDRDGSIGRLPPVLSFQSIVDATVSTPELASRFYGLLRGGDSELVLFDLNRSAGLEALLTFSPKRVIAAFEAAPRRDYRLTVLHNQSGLRSLSERSWAPGAAAPDRELPLTAIWPDDVFSLSHVALPFPPDDPLYGLGAARGADGLPGFGALAMRGETGALAMSPAAQLRLRSNPFFDLVRQRILDDIAADVAPR
jgi:alpha-beta hydrolase superfamily lysophospholipase